MNKNLSNTIQKYKQPTNKPVTNHPNRNNKIAKIPNQLKPNTKSAIDPIQERSTLKQYFDVTKDNNLKDNGKP